MQDRNGSHTILTDPPPSGFIAPYKARVAGIGRQLPDTRVTTAELMASTRRGRKIDLQRYTGIRERRNLNGEGNSHSLATNAALESLAHAELEGGELDAIVGCGITRTRGSESKLWGLEPPLAKIVAQEIGATGAIAFDVGNACAGMLTGAFVINNWIRAGIIRRGMVVSGENISPLARNAALHVRNLLSREVASLTVGDAGAAIVLERTEDDIHDVFCGFATAAKHSRLCVAHVDHDDPGPRMFTRPVALHNAAMKNMPVVYKDMLESLGLPLEEIHHVIPHQTSRSAIKTGIRKITEYLGQSLHSKALMTVDRYGNTASTSHTVALMDELEGGGVQAGERVAFLALASGLVIGAMVFTADERLVRAYANADPTATGEPATTEAAANGDGNGNGNGHVAANGTVADALVSSAAEQS
jgi:3-oxoacyl-[acyl-carrier-protein] synthase-3